MHWSYSVCSWIPLGFFISSARIETNCSSAILDTGRSFQFLDHLLSCTRRYPQEQAWVEETHFTKINSVFWSPRLTLFFSPQLFLGDWKHFSKLWLWDHIPLCMYACDMYARQGRRWDQTYLESNSSCLQAPKSELEPAMPIVLMKS